MVIVDTTVWVDYFRGTRNEQTDYLDREAGRQRFALTDLILCETLQGIGSESDFRGALGQLLTFELLDGGGTEVAIAAARNFRVLRGHGHTVRKTIDCLIATFCLLRGHSLLHRDRDFDPFEQFLG